MRNLQCAQLEHDRSVLSGRGKSREKSSPRRLTRRSERHPVAVENARDVVRRARANAPPALRSSISARARFVSSSMNPWLAASSLSSTRRRCAVSAARVQSTGLLARDAVDKALMALRRFRALCRIMKVGRVYAIATAAARDASNGPEFIAAAEKICGCEIQIISGPREAKLSALGVISGVHKPKPRRRYGWRFKRTHRCTRQFIAAGHHAAAGRSCVLGMLRRIRRSAPNASSPRPWPIFEQLDGLCRPQFLCGGRHMARARAASHPAKWLSAQGDARLHDPSCRCA